MKKRITSILIALFLILNQLPMPALAAGGNTVTVTSYNATYDGVAHTVSASAMQAGSTLYYSTDNATWSTAAPTWTDVTAAQTVYVKATKPGYDDASGRATVTITAAPITITAVTDTKVYDGEELKNSGYHITGSFAFGEGLKSVTVSGSRTHAGSSANTVTGYVLKDGTKASNYAIGTAAGTLTVLRAAYNSVVANGYTGVYDGKAHGITVTPVLPVTAGTTLYYSTDNANWLDTAPTFTDVTTAQTVYVKASNPDCISDATASATVTITAAPLTITAGSKAFVSDGSSHSDNTWSITSGRLCGSDAITVAVSGSIMKVSDSPMANTVGDVTFTSGSASNYEITKVNGSLAMMSSTELAVTVMPYSATYDGKAHTVTATASMAGTTIWYSTVASESAGESDWSTTAPTFTDATVNAAGTVTPRTVYVKAVKAGNAYVTGSATVTITRAPLTIRADDKTFYYADTVDVFTATETGYVNGETAKSAGISYSITYGVMESTDVGTHPIGLNGKTALGNYSITYVNGTAIIIKAPASKNGITATGWSGTYDGTAHGVSAFPRWHIGTTLSYSTDNVNWTSGTTTLDLNNVAPLTGAGAETVYIKAENPNFETSYAQTTVTVARRSLVLTGKTDTRTYTGSAIELTDIAQSGNGLATGQTLAGITYSAQGTDAGTYQGMFSGTAAVMSNTDNVTSNYVIATVPGTLNISKAAAKDNIVTATDCNATYDGAAHTITASAAQTGSTLYYSSTGGAEATDWSVTAPTWTDAKRDGQGNPVVHNVYVKAVNPNYEDSFGQAAVIINPADAASATVTGINGPYTYTGQAIKPVPAVNYGGNTLSEGTDYDVACSNNTNAGTAACTITFKGNYASAQPLAVSFTIAPAPVTVTAAASSKAYGAADPAFTATVSGLVNNEAEDRITYTVTRQGVGRDETAGSYTGAIVPSGAATQGNYSVTYVPADFTINQAEIGNTGSIKISLRYNNTAEQVLKAKDFGITKQGTFAAAPGFTDSWSVLNGAPSYDGDRVHYSLKPNLSSFGQEVIIPVIFTPGDSNYAPVSLTATIRLTDKNVSTLALSTANSGNSLICTAAIQKGQSVTDIPGGEVEFYLGTDNSGVSLGTAAVINSAASITLPLDRLIYGENNIYAVYGGDPAFKAASALFSARKVPVKGLTLNKQVLVLGNGEEGKLTAKASPSDATIQSVTWDSTDKGVATVEDGRVKAVGAGSTLITAVSDDDDSIRAGCRVVVTESRDIRLEELKKEDELRAGDHAVYASPSSASVSDAEIEYVDMDVLPDTATTGNAKEHQRFTLGKAQNILSKIWNGITYTLWHVFYVDETEDCKYIYVYHNRVLSVSFDPNGGTVSEKMVRTDEFGLLPSIPTAARSGYSFAGWYTAAAGGEELSQDKVFSSDSIYHAHWTKNAVEPVTPVNTGNNNGDSDSGSGINAGTGKGWSKSAQGWQYQSPSGGYVKEAWAKVNDKWYHFDSQGYMQTGWVKDKEKWYYLDGKNGDMKAGWVLDNGKWYYLDDQNGDMKTGFYKAPDGHHYYFLPDGSMATGDVEIDGVMHHFNNQLPTNPTYTQNPATNEWVPNGNNAIPYGAEITG